MSPKSYLTQKINLIKVLIQKKIKDEEKNRLINKTKKATKLKIMNKEPTPESIEYWRKKWGITKASLEENHDE